MNASARAITLIELLVVISIIAILAGILLPALHLARERTRVQKAQAEIVAVQAALEQYRTDFGDFPPSTLQELGMPGTLTNQGNEAMTACLATRRVNGPYLYGHGPDDRRFQNGDGDSGAASRTDWIFPDSQLRELVDPWDNPYVYFHGRDLKDGTTAVYRMGRRDETVSPVKDGATGVYRSALSYQLWSCGPDGLNDAGGEDDLTSWAGTVQH